MPVINLKAIKKTLRETDGRWSAATKAKEHALGYKPGPKEPTLTARELQARTLHHEFMIAAPRAAPYPPAVDWRKRAGKNYVTPIKDQKSCGSCVAFGAVATVESGIRVKKHDPALAIDLSEAHLFYCGVAGIPQGHCGPGWYPDAAFTVFQRRGVVDEKCFPYTPGDQPCRVCADWKKRVMKIARWRKLTNTTDMKKWLDKKGPLATCFSVYNDFFAYKSGVYHHVSGGLAGGHCVCCIGYSDAGRYWICKNSWGPGWGDRGFFKIAYGQVGIDATMWAAEV